MHEKDRQRSSASVHGSLPSLIHAAAAHAASAMPGCRARRPFLCAAALALFCAAMSALSSRTLQKKLYHGNSEMIQMTWGNLSLGPTLGGAGSALRQNPWKRFPSRLSANVYSCMWERGRDDISRAKLVPGGGGHIDAWRYL